MPTARASSTAACSRGSNLCGAEGGFPFQFRLTTHGVRAFMEANVATLRCGTGRESPVGEREGGGGQVSRGAGLGGARTNDEGGTPTLGGARPGFDSRQCTGFRCMDEV